MSEFFMWLIMGTVIFLPLYFFNGTITNLILKITPESYKSKVSNTSRYFPHIITGVFLIFGFFGMARDFDDWKERVEDSHEDLCDCLNDAKDIKNPGNKYRAESSCYVVYDAETIVVRDVEYLTIEEVGELMQLRSDLRRKCD